MDCAEDVDSALKKCASDLVFNICKKSFRFGLNGNGSDGTTIGAFVGGLVGAFFVVGGKVGDSVGGSVGLRVIGLVGDLVGSLCFPVRSALRRCRTGAATEYSIADGGGYEPPGSGVR